MKREEAEKYLEQFTDEEVKTIYGMILEILRRREPAEVLLEKDPR